MACVSTENEDPILERDQLREALETQPVIEQAKGMLMLLRTLSADEAFAALKKVSQHTNVKLHDVATVIVAAGSARETTLDDPAVVDAILTETRQSIVGVHFSA